jgi:hypothetical protein
LMETKLTIRVDTKRDTPLALFTIALARLAVTAPPHHNSVVLSAVAPVMQERNTL